MPASAIVWLVVQSVTAGPAAEFAGPRVRESSGIAVSRAHPDVLWTHNDSGDGPFLYATDLLGRDRGWLRIPGARAADWEDIAIGPCPPPIKGQLHCLYLADTGDNVERRPQVTVYAVPEPAPPTGPGDTLRTTAVLRLRYPDGSHDVEAVYVSPRDSALYLVSKGRSGPIRVYRVNAEQWAAPDEIAVATAVQTLDIRPSMEAGRVVTGAGIRPDGRVVALRTYTEIFLFNPGVGGRLVPARERPCGIASEASGRHTGTIRTVVCHR
ncbi:MAG: hypothetical protein Q8Q14_04085 [Gemmatimonadales bacterium]|nr:hypothetical protein [Gemmatimonadales bacterium]